MEIISKLVAVVLIVTAFGFAGVAYSHKNSTVQCVSIPNG